MFDKRINDLKSYLKSFIESESLMINDFKPSKFDKKPGVIGFFDKNELCLIVISTNDMLRKAYYNEYQGNGSTASLKRNLVTNKNMTYETAKIWIKQNVCCRYMYTDTTEEAVLLAGALAFMLQPKYISN